MVMQQAQNKMATQPVRSLILRMSLPPLISMFMQFSYNFIDSAFVAKLSENALTAVSLSFPLTSLMNAISVWLGVGVSVMISSHLGKGEQEQADHAATIGLLLSFAVGVIMNLAGLLVLRPYFAAFAKDAEIHSLCMTYMRVCVYMQIPNMVHIMIQKIIQATGNMVTPMLFQVAGVVFNLIFDPILIFGLFGFPKMGISGAALSTVLGYTLSMLLALWMLLGRRQKVCVRFKGLQVRWESIKSVFVFGLPSFIMQAISAIMVSIVNTFLVHYSTTAVAFFGAYFKLQQMIVMTVNGLIQGCLPVMSFNYAAGERRRLQDAYHWGTCFVCIAMAIGTLAVLLFPRPILGLFAASEEMLSFGIDAMRLMCLGYLFNGMTAMASAYLLSTGQVPASVTVNLLQQLLLLLPLLWLFSSLWGLGGIWLAFPVTEVLTFLVSFTLQRRQSHRLAAAM